MGAKKRSKAKQADFTFYDDELDASLLEEAKRRYVNYALSVITSRALPDVRDGLKPVQRRILYAMYHDEHLHPEAKHRKSAKVVGSVIGRYHPHGDTAVYDAMVRMAQDFALRMPLVEGSGNFGSLDGDSAAAYRYTECRMAPPAIELLRELKQDTVPFRGNYDGTTSEPVVLPAKLPNLLVNGSTGIAVGMATNIPPHNLREVCQALQALIDKPEMTTTNILKFVKGPDFPVGGQVLNSKVELRQIYNEGQGPIKVRAQFKLEKRGRGGENVILTSIPYATNKSTIVEKIADVIRGKKLPQLVDVRDESTADIRVVLELKNGADPDMVMAYLFKHTPLQQNFNVNLTCLMPNAQGGLTPDRVGIKEILQAFLDFRFDVTQKRFEYELAALKKRIHILKAFKTIFDALDETIRIIRKSDGKQDAAAKLMKRFKLDKVQVDAILELRLYKLAKLEINLIREELKEKLAAAKKIEAILKSKKKLWGVVKTEIGEMADQFGTPRRTEIAGPPEETEFDAEAYIVDEDAHVVISRDGWMKRVREVKDPAKLRVREGDSIGWIVPGSTKECVALFTNLGTAYVTRINEVPATTGYGDPAQKLFKFKDKERIVFAMTLDSRAMLPEQMICCSAKGYGQRFLLSPYLEPTTRAGRKYARPSKGDEIVAVSATSDKDILVAATHSGHALICKAKEVKQLENPGKGVMVIKVASDDNVIGFLSGSHKKESLTLQSTTGSKKFQVFADGKKAKSRGGKGHQLVKRSKLKWLPPEVTVPVLANADAKGVH